MSTDLFGMAVENRKSIRELIIVGSQRIDYYPLLEAARNFIKPLIFDNVNLISLDKIFINGLIVCKHCHMLFTDTRWNRPVFLKHLAKFHEIEHKEPKPEPTIPKRPKKNPIQFTETPLTITLIEPNTEVRVPPTDSEKPKEEVAKAVAPSEAVRKSHHKKKIPIKVEPICLDTISDPSYVCKPPFPLVSEDWVKDWEAPLEKKTKSQKRKARAPSDSKPTGEKAAAKKKTASKKPKLGGEEKSNAHLEHPNAELPILHPQARPPHAKKTPKPHLAPIKHAESEVLSC